MNGYRGALPSGSNVPCCIVTDFSFDAKAMSRFVLKSRTTVRV